MVMTKRRYRVISGALAILALLIFCGTPFQQAAEAVAVVDDAIIAIVIAALAAMGITFTMSGGYQTVRDWIRDMIIESGIDFYGVKYGASSVGSLLLNNVFVRRIAAFATYIKAELGLLDNSTNVIFSSSATIGDIVTYPGREWLFTAATNPNEGVAWISSSTVHCIYLVSGTQYLIPVLYDDSPFEAKAVSSNNAGNINWDNIAWNTAEEYDQTDFYYRVPMLVNRSKYGLQNVEAYNYSLNELLAYLSGKVPELRNSLTANTGTISIPDDTTIGSQGGVLSLPVPWGQSMGTTLTDIPGLVLSDELVGNTTLELEDASAVEDQVSDTATAEQPYVSSSVSDYQSPGLSSVFPFCIPFDLYAFFECLAADPEAPEISWRFYVPGICDEEINIDLSQFDTVAQIVRTMELLAFIVGLALVTREKFLRG